MGFERNSPPPNPPLCAPPVHPIIFLKNNMGCTGGANKGG